MRLGGAYIGAVSPSPRNPIGRNPTGRNPNGRNPNGSDLEKNDPKGLQKDRPPGSGLPAPGSSWPRPVVWALIGVALLALVAAPALSPSKADKLDYSTFRQRVESGEIASVKVTNDSSRIRGKYKDEARTDFTTTAPAIIPDDDLALFREKGVKVEFLPPSSNLVGTLLVWLLPIGLLILFWWWMGKRAQGQMAGIMSIGRSKAKVYTTEKPKTTFADVAGYNGVKQEINEVVDFLKQPQKFRDLSLIHI